MNIPKELKYSKDHEWVKVEGNIATVGITDFAQNELGDIVYVEADKIEEEVEQEEIFGSIEAVKTVSDLFSPVSGKLIEFNEEIEDTPEIVNDDPYGKGWIVKIEIKDTSDLDSLMSAEEYEKMVG